MIPLKIENLCMSFGTQVIFDNVSFQINNNDKVGIIGVNGAGKSTLLNKLDKSLLLETNEISKALGRGKHTFRQLNTRLRKHNFRYQNKFRLFTPSNHGRCIK